MALRKKADWMARLHVRNIPDELVAALKERIAPKRCSIAAEHRHILKKR